MVAAGDGAHLIGRVLVGAAGLVAVLDAEVAASTLDQVHAFFRAVVIDRDEQATSGDDEPSQEGPVVSDGSDTDMLLIDFR